MSKSNAVCGWCQDDAYFDANGQCFECVCKVDCGHGVCGKGVLDATIHNPNGDPVSKKFKTINGQECIWCDTTKPCNKDKCSCESDCGQKHCLLGSSKGTYSGGGGTSSWSKAKGGGTTSWNGNGSYGGITTYTCSKKHPTVLFKWNDISFSGFPKGDLEKCVGKAGDPKRLLINASNYGFSPYTPTSPSKIVDKAPDAFKELLDEKYLIQPPKGEPYFSDVIDLNWSDGRALPAELEWWMKLLELIVQGGYKEVVACCAGGHGRTGTALGIILMLTHSWKKSPSVEAENWIKENYCKRAIETKEQQEYLDYIMMAMAEPKGEQKAQVDA